jgi:hypothetical protein
MLPKWLRRRRDFAIPRSRQLRRGSCRRGQALSTAPRTRREWQRRPASAACTQCASCGADQAARSFARTSARHGFRLCRDPVKAVSYECQKCRRTLGAPRPRRHRIVLPFPGSTYPARVQKLLAIVEFAARSIPTFRAKANQRAAACIGPSTQLEPGPLFDPCLEEQKPRCIRN